MVGDYALALALIERVRAASGNFAAATTRLELRAWIKRERAERDRRLSRANRSIASVVEVGQHDSEAENDPDSPE
jgi:hypothetical protein